MVDTKKVAISYFFAFASVYLLFISYSVLIRLVRYEFNYELPQTEAINATSYAVTSLSESPISWFMIVVLAGIAAVILGLLSSLRMFGAHAETS